MGFTGLTVGSWEMKAIPVRFEIMDGGSVIGRVDMFGEHSTAVEIIEPCHGIESWEALSAEVVRAMRDMGLDAQAA